MKRIKPEELPLELTEEIKEVLVSMAMEFPKTTFDWANISKVLSQRGQLNIILDEVEKLQLKKEKEQESQMTSEDKKQEEENGKKLKRTRILINFTGTWDNQKLLLNIKTDTEFILLAMMKMGIKYKVNFIQL